MAGEKNCEVEALEQRCAQLENDMQKMQERLAWMDMTLNDTGKYIDNLLDRVDKLERQIKFLASMQDAPAAVRPLSEETPPPHYQLASRAKAIQMHPHLQGHTVAKIQLITYC